ncbi:hypothetical protein UlMin_040699 [Ulmus minor]
MTKLPLYFFFFFYFTFFFSYLSSTFHYLFNPFSSNFTRIIEEFSDINRNQVFDAAKLYLWTKVSPSTSHLHVSKTPKQKLFKVLIKKGEKINDEFEGIKIKWRFVYVESKGDQFTRSSEKRIFEISFHKKFKDTLVNSYLPYVLFKARIKISQITDISQECPYNDDDDGRGSGIWGSVNLEHPVTFETLAMESELKKEVIDDLGRFVKRRYLYEKVGKAWKRGYLLYGSPGTGKSSLIPAMANYLKFDVYDLELTSIFNNSDLRRVLLSTLNRSIFFFTKMEGFEVVMAILVFEPFGI